MYWKLSQAYSLRSWQDKPYALLRRPEGKIIEITEEDFGLLQCCNGMVPMPGSPKLGSYEKKDWIERCETPSPLPENQRLVRYDVNQFDSVNIAITGFCNYNCRHCFMAKDAVATRSEFSLKQLEKMLDDCVAAGITRVSITGGEPFVRKDLDLVFRAIAKRGLVLENITANGSLIHDELLALMHELGLDPLMRISYDGVGHHDWMRGVPGAEEVALDAIRRIKKAGFRVLAQMCVHTGNLSSMRATAELMAEMGVDQLRIMRTGEAPRWIERMEGHALSFEAYYDAALDFLQWYVGSGLMMNLIIWSFVRYEPATGFFHCLPVRCPTGECVPESPLCSDTRHELFIGYDGEISPCSQLSGKFGVSGISLGNVLKDDLATLLRQGLYLEYVNKPVCALTGANEECRACEYVRYCLGGCRGMAFAMTDDFLGADRMSCVFFKKGYWKRLYRVMKQEEIPVKA
ncbi:MAG: radical SAM protein [Bacillota bacterium]